MPEISVIVPVYRVEAYLSRCLDSLTIQSFGDFECILVDDGSPDRSGEICERYARADDRFQVIHQANGGLSAARNTGMAEAKGNWITFLDSDDWLHPETLGWLHSAAVEQGTDLALCGLKTVEAFESDPLPNPDVQVLSGRDALLRLYTHGGGRYVVAVAKLWRRERLGEFRFPAGRLHEDEATTYRLLYPMERIAEVDAPLYYYYQNPESITRNTYSPKRLDALTALEEQIDFYREIGDGALEAQTLQGYLHKASEHTQAIRETLQDGDLERSVIDRVEAFCRDRDLGITHSQRLLLLGDIHSGMKLRVAKLRDLVAEVGIGGCVAYYWKKLF